MAEDCRIGVDVKRDGKFLIAKPNQISGFFNKSVVFIYEDGAQGTVGLTINKPTPVDFAQMALERGREYPSGINYLFSGGPVNSRAITMIHTDEWSSQNTLHTGHGVDLSSDELMLQKLIDNNVPKQYRLMAGASVWGPQQLSQEISRGSWLLTHLPVGVIFESQGDSQWERCIELAGQQFVAAWF